jgi:hypothetical protein
MIGQANCRLEAGQSDGHCHFNEQLPFLWTRAFQNTMHPSRLGLAVSIRSPYNLGMLSDYAVGLLPKVTLVMLMRNGQFMAVGAATRTTQTVRMGDSESSRTSSKDWTGSGPKSAALMSPFEASSKPADRNPWFLVLA